MKRPLDEDPPSAERFRRIREVFELAVERPCYEREAFLEQACRGDDALLQEVLRMLDQNSTLTLVDQPAWRAFPELLDEKPGPAAGAQLGPYRIEGVLGAGGMGRVYKATDTRLARLVALKISRRQFGEQVEREARAIAALNHPHICAIYDVGPDYLVMEFVPGTTLAEKIERGPLPWKEALRIGCEVADALACAHSKGIRHGDLKPGNVMVDDAGRVKVLDFGLATLLAQNPDVQQTAPFGRSSAGRLDPEDVNPGLMSPAGSFAGTVAYASPEQAAGKMADARSDIFSFGVVLYEMLCGRNPFQRETPRQTIEAIPREVPVAPRRTQSKIPRMLEAIVMRCLEKQPDARYRSVSELHSDLEALQARFASRVGSRRVRWPWSVPIAALLGTAAALWLQSNKLEQPVLQVEISPPDGVTFGPNGIGTLSLSPDGRMIVYWASAKDRKRMLWVRQLDSGNTYPLAGTEDAAWAFFSPDSRWIGFSSHGKLQKVRTSGGRIQTICDCVGPGAWISRSTILLSDPGLRGKPIQLVSADGGAPVPIFSALDGSAEETAEGTPVGLPDGHHFLFVSYTSKGQRAVFGSLDGKIRRALLTGEQFRYLVYVPNPRGGGWMLYRDRDHHVARPFDPTAGEFKGDPVIIPRTEDSDGLTWTASATGILAFRRDRISQMTWFDRAGKILGFVAEPDTLNYSPRISPAGRSIVFFRRHERESEIWLVDGPNSAPRRLTMEPPEERFEDYPIFSSDGSQVLYRSWSRRKDQDFLVERPMTGGGAESAVPTDVRLDPNSASRDGRWLAVAIMGGRKRDIGVWSLAANRLIPVPNPSGADRSNASISPDGRWLAYSYLGSAYTDFRSTDDAPEVRVRRMPPSAGGDASSTELRISGPGGWNPVWSGDGREIFYLSSDGNLMAAPIEEGPHAVRSGVPVVLFQTHLRPEVVRDFDVTADGKRFLVNQPIDPPITVIVNWPRLLSGNK